MFYNTSKVRMNFASIKKIYIDSVHKPAGAHLGMTLNFIFESSSLKDDFYSREIFEDLSGLRSSNPYSANTEEEFVEAVNYYLFLVSVMDYGKVAPYYKDDANKMKERLINFATKYMPKIGYRLQEHSDGKILSLVPTEVKEFHQRVSENLEDNKILEYYSYKGDLDSKRSILRELWLPFEEIRASYEKTFKGAASDISRVLNKYGIRHSLEKENGIPTNIQEDDEMIERHYDHVFGLLVRALEFEAK